MVCKENGLLEFRTILRHSEAEAIFGLGYIKFRFHKLDETKETLGGADKLYHYDVIQEPWLTYIN